MAQIAFGSAKIPSCDVQTPLAVPRPTVVLATATPDVRTRQALQRHSWPLHRNIIDTVLLTPPQAQHGRRTPTKLSRPMLGSPVPTRHLGKGAPPYDPTQACLYQQPVPTHQVARLQFASTWRREQNCAPSRPKLPSK